MARHRSRSYSPRRRSRNRPDDDRRRDRRSSGLLVRNLPLTARPEDLRIPFEQYGPVKDVYLPKNFHTGKPRGFGFVKYCHAGDAAEAKQQLNNSVIGGREISIVYAEENRKTPEQMRLFCRPSGRYGGSHRRRTPPRSPRRRYHTSSRSPSPVRDRRHRDDDRSPVHACSISRSPLHEHRKSRCRSPPPNRDHDKSPSPRAEEMERSPSMSRSPRGGTAVQTPSGSRSRSYSPR